MVLYWPLGISQIRRRRDRFMFTSTTSFSRRLGLVTITMAFVTGLVVGILLPIYVPTSSTPSALPAIPNYAPLYPSSLDSGLRSTLTQDSAGYVSPEQWKTNGVVVLSDAEEGRLLERRRMRTRRRVARLVVPSAEEGDGGDDDDVRVVSSLTDPDQVQGGTPHGALSWPVLDTSPPPSSTLAMSLPQQDYQEHHHQLPRRPESNRVHGPDRRSSPEQELTSGPAPSQINHTSLNAKWRRQQVEEQIIITRGSSKRVVVTPLKDEERKMEVVPSLLSSAFVLSQPRTDWQQPDRWSQVSKMYPKVQLPPRNDLLLRPATGTAEEAGQLVGRQTGGQSLDQTGGQLLDQTVADSKSPSSSNYSSSSDLAAVEHSDDLGEVPIHLALSASTPPSPTSIPTTTTSATRSGTMTRLLLLPRMLASRRNFTQPSGQRLVGWREVTTQPNPVDLVNLPQITRPIPISVQTGEEKNNNGVLHTIHSELDVDDKTLLELAYKSSLTSTADELFDGHVGTKKAAVDTSGQRTDNNGGRTVFHHVDNNGQWNEDEQREQSRSQPLFQTLKIAPEQGSVPGSNSTRQQAGGDFVPTLDSLVSDGVYWSPGVEAMLPQGFTPEDVRNWVDYVSKVTVVRVAEGCGRMQNRQLTFDNGTQSCCRYRQNNDQIQGDIFSFYLAQLLGLPNLPPATLGLLHGHDRQWRQVRGQLTLAQWNEQKPVVMTKFVDDLVPAYIPKQFRGDGPQEVRRLHPVAQDLLGLSGGDEELRELVQFSDLVIFDYLTANLDRVVNNMYNRQWNPDMMTAPAHNLAKVAKTGLLVFLDNESGLLHGYRLLDKYETYHRAMLDGLCVFRRSTARAVLELNRKGDTGLRLKMALLESQPQMTEWLPLLPDKSVKILQERLARVAHQIRTCESRFANRQEQDVNMNRIGESDEDYADSLSNPLQT